MSHTWNSGFGWGWPDGKPKPKKQPSNSGKAVRLRKTKWLRDNHCNYCGIELAWDDATLDHVIPRSRGGATTEENTVLACKSCNNKKADKVLREAMKTLTEKDVQDRLKHTKAKTANDGKRCVIYFPGSLPLRNPHQGVRVIIADCGSWRDAYDTVKDRRDLGKAKSVTLKPDNARFKTPECWDAHRLSTYLRLYEKTETEVLEHKDVYYVVPQTEPDLFSGL